MANQAIALQARAPQMPSLSGAIQQNAMLINQMTQAQASRRQAEKTQQEMALAKSKEAREVSEAQVKYAGEVAKVFKEELAMLPPGDVRGAEALRRMTVERVPGWDAILPSADAIANDKGTRQRLLMKADEIISYSLAKPVASAQQDAEGNFYGVTVGGLGAPKAEKVVITPTLPEAKAPPASPQKIIDDGVAAILEGAGVNDPRLQNLDEKQFREIQSRASQQLLAKPIAYEPSAVSEVEPLTLENAPQIVQAALDSGFIDPVHVEQLKQMLPPENQAAVDQWVQQNGLKMGKGVPGAQSAVYRPQQADFGPAVADDGMAFGGPQAPFAQQVVNEPGTQFRGKPPMQSPTPGTVNVPIPRISQAAGAEEEGKKSAAYKAELTQSLPKAKGALKLATSQLDRDIADIDYVLRNPYREMVIGQVEGAFPSATSFVNIFRKGGQEAQNVQDRLGKINASSVVKHLQQMREASPQGSSLFGQVTEYEDRLVAALAGLKQTQDEKTFDRALREYRNVLVEMRQNLPEVFNDTYKSVGGKAAVGAPAPAPGKTPTRSDIEYLRRNRKNPNVVNGFRKAFGAAAFNQAMGND